MLHLHRSKILRLWRVAGRVSSLRAPGWGFEAVTTQRTLTCQMACSRRTHLIPPLSCSEDSTDFKVRTCNPYTDHCPNNRHDYLTQALRTTTISTRNTGSTYHDHEYQKYHHTHYCTTITRPTATTTNIAAAALRLLLLLLLLLRRLLLLLLATPPPRLPTTWRLNPSSSSASSTKMTAAEDAGVQAPYQFVTAAEVADAHLP